MAEKDSLQHDSESEPKLDITPLIDMSFLLLIYFMIAATLLKQEADLGIILPGVVAEGSEPVHVDQMVISVEASGAILVNEEVVDSSLNSRQVPVLKERLRRYRGVAELTGTQPLVIIQCADAVAEQRFVDVLNACAAAGIRHVSISR